MKKSSGWHHAPKPRKKDLDGLTLTWIHDGGWEIYQGWHPIGRLVTEERRFVYRLVAPWGTESEFDQLGEAKAARLR